MIAAIDQLEGVHLGMSFADYTAIPALSYSGMKRMKVSPLNYWQHHLNPNRPASTTTAAQAFGNAVHFRMLEPDQFDKRYATALDKSKYQDVLSTMDDLKDFCVANGLKVSAKRKEDLIERINLAGYNPPIWESMVANHTRANSGKMFLTAEEADKIEAMAEVMSSDPETMELLSGGNSEVVIVLRDPESGVLLKCRIDYAKTIKDADIKTFTNSKEQPIRRAVMNELHYRDYLGQGVFYHNMRETAVELGIPGCEHLKGLPAAFTFIFIESEPPHHLELVELHPSHDAIHWQASISFIQQSVSTYAEYMRKFGIKPWRPAARPHLLQDRDIPQLAFT